MATAEESKSGVAGKSSANGATVGDFAGVAAAAVNQQIDQAVSSVHTKVDKIADVARPAAERLASNAQAAVDKLSSAASKATETLGATGEQLNALQDRVVDECRTYVRAKPIAALSIAVVAGVILSRLFSSR